MDEKIPGSDPCLTDDERRELQAAWRQMQPNLQALGELIEQGDLVDCDQLHDRLLELSNTFDEVEHLIMRAKQLRMLRPGHGTAWEME